jgi:hypothetical protein
MLEFVPTICFSLAVAGFLFLTPQGHGTKSGALIATIVGALLGCVMAGSAPMNQWAASSIAGFFVNLILACVCVGAGMGSFIDGKKLRGSVLCAFDALIITGMVG